MLLTQQGFEQQLRAFEATGQNVELAYQMMLRARVSTSTNTPLHHSIATDCGHNVSHSLFELSVQCLAHCGCINCAALRC
jgi:hypothetical protein